MKKVIVGLHIPIGILYANISIESLYALIISLAILGYWAFYDEVKWYKYTKNNPINKKNPEKDIAERLYNYQLGGNKPPEAYSDVVGIAILAAHIIWSIVLITIIINSKI